MDKHRMHQQLEDFMQFCDTVDLKRIINAADRRGSTLG